MENSMKNSRIVSLPISLSVSISRTMAGLVERMMGPCGEQTLLATSTGKVLLTRDGWTVLSSLHLAHPLASLIMKTLSSYHTLHGDGSKTFIQYLSAILKAVADTVDEKGRSEHAKLARIKMARDLDHFLRIDFDKAAKTVIEKAQSFQTCSAGCDENRRAKLKSVLRTSLNTCIQKQLFDFFTDLLCSFVGLEDCSVKDVDGYLLHVLEHFDMYHSKVANQPQQRSFVCQGVLLEADLQPAFSSCENDALNSKCARKCVLVNIDFEMKNGRNDVWLKPSSENLSHLFSYKRQRLKQFFHRLKSASVDVILCADAVPQFVSGMCQDEGFHLFCIPAERIEFLGHVAGVSVLKDVNLEHFCDNLNDVVFSASVSSFVSVGNKRSSVICVESCSSTSVLKRQSHMVLCAPTEGMCEQLCKSVYKALKVLHLCLQPYSGIHCRETSDNDTKSKTQLTQSFQMHQSTNLETLTVPCGGAFEAALFVAVEDYFEKNYADSRTVGRVIQEMLTAATQGLHANLCSGSVSAGRQFIAKWMRMLASARQGQLYGFDSHGNVCIEVCEFGRERGEIDLCCGHSRLGSATNTCGALHGCDQNVSGGLEPLGCKLSLVAHVLQLVIQLLRVESIVPVRHLPQTCDGDNDNTSDEDG